MQPEKQRDREMELEAQRRRELHRRSRETAQDHCRIKEVHRMQTGTLMVICVTRPKRNSTHFEAERMQIKINE